MLKTLIDGGPLMIILMAESVLAIAVALDRWVAFRANNRVDVRTLRAKVQKQMLAGKYDDAMAVCLTTPGPVSAVMAAGLQSYIRHRVVTSNGETLRAIMQDAMADYARMAMSMVEKRMNVLSFIGTSAPLFGMTGTVTGMIRSFAAIAAAGDVDATVVASGISEALITTAAGLLIAMMAVIPHHYFMGCSESIEIEAAEAGSEILDHVSLTHHVAPAKA